MERDRSLDEFAGGASGSSQSTEADAEPAGEDANIDRGSADEERDADAGSDGESADGAEPVADAVDAADGADTANGADTADGADAAEDVEPTGDADATAGVEPAVATYRWEPDGTACPDCGRVAERLWSQDGELVCAGCKAW